MKSALVEAPAAVSNSLLENLSQREIPSLYGLRGIAALAVVLYHYLLDTKLELNEAAFLLGYEDASSFFRAFFELLRILCFSSRRSFRYFAILLASILFPPPKWISVI